MTIWEPAHEKIGGTPSIFSLPDFIDLSEREPMVFRTFTPKSLENEGITACIRDYKLAQKERENSKSEIHYFLFSRG